MYFIYWDEEQKRRPIADLIWSSNLFSKKKVAALFSETTKRTSLFKDLIFLSWVTFPWQRLCVKTVFSNVYSRESIRWKREVTALCVAIFCCLKPAPTISNRCENCTNALKHCSRPRRKISNFTHLFSLCALEAGPFENYFSQYLKCIWHMWHHFHSNILKSMEMKNQINVTFPPTFCH